MDITVYKNIAKYDEFQIGFLKHASKNIIELYENIFKNLPLNSFKKILDVGVGSGLNLKYFPKETEVYGIDQSEEMIDKARQRSSEAKLVVGNAEKLPYEDNYFDCVFVLFVLCSSKNPRKIFEEAKRVCKPNGYIALFDYHKADENSTVLADQYFLNETMKKGLYFKDSPILVFDTLYSLEENTSFDDFEIIFDEKISNMFSESFRGTVLKKI